jgi:hypothetical protein
MRRCCWPPRRARLDEKIIVLAADSEFTPLARRLACLRGIAALTGFALAVEIGDWGRFTGASIGAHLGLVPSEHSSGQSRCQGGITKTGNAHVRRLLVEAAWHHRTSYRPGAVLQRRWDAAPAATRARGHAGNQRLHARWVNLNLRKKRPVIAISSLPVLLFSDVRAQETIGDVPAVLVGAVGYLVARRTGSGHLAALFYGLTALAVGVVVALVKAKLSAH